MSTHGRFIAGDAKIAGRFKYARQLQRLVQSATIILIDLSRRATSAIEDLVNSLADFSIADDDETPRLHSPAEGAWWAASSRRASTSSSTVVGLKERAHIPPLVDRAIKSATFFLAESMYALIHACFGPHHLPAHYIAE
ncbi:MAG TPA: hypothetical protein VK208_02320 [Pyrinomonadaceae bacterium]|jgi:hypothetical protein|nr:hypothetical protein [Pyrinomonadaceae bacterium]